jgi:ribose 5-phosphate isomerase A
LSNKSAMISSGLERAARAIAANEIEDNSILGLGSGSAVAKFATALGERVRSEHLHIQVIPSSMQAWLLARENGLPLLSDSAHSPPSLQACVDGADQISKRSRCMVKGGGGALLREKILLYNSERNIIIADESKFVQELEREVPVEIFPFAYLTVQERLRGHFSANPVLRKLDKGYPFSTESGNLILDVKFPKPVADPSQAEKDIKTIPGVAEAGIFACNVKAFYKANYDGSFETV